MRFCLPHVFFSGMGVLCFGLQTCFQVMGFELCRRAKELKQCYEGSKLGSKGKFESKGNRTNGLWFLSGGME